MGFSLTEEEDDPAAVKRAAYVRYLETMTEQTSALGAKHFAKDARYQGPFYDVYGRAHVVQLFMDRFKTMPDYRLKIAAQFYQDHVLYIRWDMIGTKDGRKKIVTGMSEVTFDLKGLVLSHIDYYDPVRGDAFGGRMARFLSALLKKFYSTLK